MSDINGTWCPVSEAAKIPGVSPETGILRIFRVAKRETNGWSQMSDSFGQS